MNRWPTPMRRVRLTTAVTLVLAVLVPVLAGGLVYSFVIQGRATTALCSLRGDLQQRVDSSTRFLVEHPQGIPGIPVQTIRDGIVNQRRTIRALRVLRC